MIVEIELSVFEKEHFFDVIDKLVDLFMSGKHSWYIFEIDEVYESPWLKSEGQSRLRRKVDFLYKATVEGAYISNKERQLKRKLVVSEQPKGEFSCSPEHALLSLSDAAYIIVENINSDKCFIQAIARSYNQEDLLHAIENEWVKFDSEGGKGGIIRRVEDHFSKKFIPRLFVLVDSDREFPGDNHQASEIEEVCNEKSISIRILNKRAIENYIPIEAFRNLGAELGEVLEAYKMLSDEQKDYYDLKNGFSGKGKLPEKQQKLFNEINSKHPLFKALRNGFRVGKFNPNSLYTLFQDEKEVTKVNLEKRCHGERKELQNLMEAIYGLL